MTAACFLASTIIPFPSEAYFASILLRGGSFTLCLLLATLGNSLGGATTFYIGMKGGDYARLKASNKSKKNYLRASQLIKRFGPVALILSFLPIIGDILVILAGALRLATLKSIFWMTFGKFLRYLAVGGSVLGLWEYFKL